MAWRRSDAAQQLTIRPASQRCRLAMQGVVRWFVLTIGGEAMLADSRDAYWCGGSVDSGSGARCGDARSGAGSVSSKITPRVRCALGISRSGAGSARDSVGADNVRFGFLHEFRGF